MSSISSLQAMPNMLVQPKTQPAQVMAAGVDSDGDHDGSGPGDADRGSMVNIKA